MGNGASGKYPGSTKRRQIDLGDPRAGHAIVGRRGFGDAGALGRSPADPLRRTVCVQDLRRASLAASVSLTKVTIVGGATGRKTANA
jgi:hypothetical protein